MCRPRADPAPAAAPPSREFEEQLGTRWAVWIGGLALALGGVFLVRYSIEQGLLGPGARVAGRALRACADRGRRMDAPARDRPFGAGPALGPYSGRADRRRDLTAFATAYAAYAFTA